MVERAARDAGVEASPRTLRHTFAIRYLSEHREDIDGLARALGHAGLASVRAYRAVARAGAPALRPVRWASLEESAPARGVRRSAHRGSSVVIERDVVAPGAGLSPQAFPHERVVFVLSGRIVVRAGADRVEVGAGEFLSIPADTMHEIAAEGGRAARLLHVAAGSRRSEPAARESGADPKRVSAPPASRRPRRSRRRAGPTSRTRPPSAT